MELENAKYRVVIGRLAYHQAYGFIAKENQFLSTKSDFKGQESNGRVTATSLGNIAIRHQRPLRSPIAPREFVGGHL